MHAHASQKQYDLGQLVFALSGVVDLIEPRLADHHRRTALIAKSLAQALAWPGKRTDRLVLSALVHDLGAFRLRERVALLEFEEGDGGRHGLVGANQLALCAPFEPMAPFVRWHHARWDEEGRDEVPEESFLLHLADRIAVSLPPGNPDIHVVNELARRVQEERGRKFSPMAVEAFLSLAENESFWFDLSYRLDEREAFLPERREDGLRVDLAGIRDVGKFVCAVVDYRSAFTATHSCGVGAVSAALAQRLGRDEAGVLELESAGYLHDIGKMAVPEEIIEKPGQLDPREWFVMKQHPYHSKRILGQVDGLQRISDACAYHHEKAGLKSYPFHIPPSGIPEEARIVAVADIFTALTEDRPYRTGLGFRETIPHLKRMAGDGTLEPAFVRVVTEQFEDFHEIRAQAQESALASYRDAASSF